jgi:hypothetical protein
VKSLRYAILQKTLDVPNVDALRRAFRAVRCLVDSDAHSLASDAYGILVKNLGVDDAMTLQRALQAEGIETEVLPQRSLPQLPQTKFVRRIECGADALVIYDPIGRPFPVEWRHVMLIAAGSIMSTRFTRKTLPPSVGGALFGNVGWGRRAAPTVMASFPRIESREERRGVLTIDLILSRAMARFTITADDSAPMLFRCLGERETVELTENFRQLIEELSRSAPGALCNRGVTFLRQTPPTLVGYPSSNAFCEETIWMLRRAGL